MKKQLSPSTTKAPKINKIKNPFTKEYYERLDLVVEEAQETRRKYQPTLQIIKEPQVQLVDLLGELDEIVDEVFAKKKELDFNLGSWLKQKSVSEENVSKIQVYFKKIYDELKEASEYSITKKRVEIAYRIADEQDITVNQMAEGYQFLDGYQKQRLIEFFEGLAARCDDFLGMKKRAKSAERKPRVKKALSVQKQVAAVKFLKECPEFGLVSINPQDVVGAMTLWTYNIAYKQLSFYRASDRTGFKVKGMALVNYDEDLSKMQSLRKPQETLKEVLTFSDRDLPTIMPKLTTKDGKANGRFHQKTLILRVGKV